MESYDALGPRPERRKAFTREMLAETDDVALQEIVRQAARELDTPVALVTLVLDDVQFFKAYYGLPAELEASRGTERDVSFCQFVVRDGEPFEVKDAAQDPRVPQHLVEEYGIRAYLGMPLWVGEIVIGSLCVIDTKARAFTEPEREALKRLAVAVDERMKALAVRRQHSRMALTEGVAAPAIAELGESLAPLRDGVKEGLQAGVAIRTFLRLFAYVQEGGALSPEVMKRSLDAAARALEQNENVLYDMEAALGDSEDCVTALEYLMTPGRAARVSEVLSAAQDLARRRTRPVGGAKLPEIGFDPLVSAPRPLAVALVTTCLTLLARNLQDLPDPEGIYTEVREEEGEVTLVFKGAGLTGDVIGGIVKELHGRMLGDPSVKVGGGEDAVELCFLTTSQPDS